MINQAKILITLTALQVTEEGKIQFSITDGITQYTGTTASVDTIIGDIGHLATEFNSATLQLGLIGNMAPIEAMKRYYKVAIDLDLAMDMQRRFKDEPGHPVIPIIEYVVNSFDTINGNRAVSTSVGLAGVVNALQDEAKANTIRPVFDRLDKILYQTHPMDFKANCTQLIESIDTDTGVEVAMTVTHALGNVFAEGTIGKIKVRILKRESLSLYVAVGEEFAPAPNAFSLDNRKGFFDVLDQFVVASV